MLNHLTADLQIENALFHAYLIYDIADTIDLEKLQRIDSSSFQKAQLELRSLASPSYIKFAVPPLALNLLPVKIGNYAADVKLKLYDYGTLSIRLSFPFSGKWSDFSLLTHELRQIDRLEKCGIDLLQNILQEIHLALNKPHAPLVEEYFILEIQKFQPPLLPAELTSKYRAQLACLLSGETQPLHLVEQEEALRTCFNYSENDLAIIQWDSAFIYDTRENAEAIESILEFANTQLVELRTYDARLDEELDEIYKWNLTQPKSQWLLERHTNALRLDRLRFLLVDIRELADRSSNAIKIIGDAYYARLYRAVALRLGLPDWQQQLESKINSIGEIYRFATDQSQYARSEFLEIIIIVLIVIEIVLALIALSH